jgi:hypothetical protein
MRPLSGWSRPLSGLLWHLGLPDMDDGACTARLPWRCWSRILLISAHADVGFVNMHAESADLLKTRPSTYVFICLFDCRV